MSEKIIKAVQAEVKEKRVAKWNASNMQHDN